jgi:hypothetical protein
MRCRKHIYNYFESLTIPLLQLEFLEPYIKEFMFDLCWILEGKWGSPRDCGAKKVVHFLGFSGLRGMRDCWL